jgi:nicotinamidase-related amidase
VHCWEDVLGAEERLVARGYAGPREVRGRRGLLLVDLYNRAFGPRRAPLAQALAEEPSSCGHAGWDALPALTRLLGTARSAGVPVVHTIAGAGADIATLRTASSSSEPAGTVQPWGVAYWCMTLDTEIEEVGMAEPQGWPLRRPLGVGSPR